MKRHQAHLVSVLQGQDMTAEGASRASVALTTVFHSTSRGLAHRTRVRDTEGEQGRITLAICRDVLARTVVHDGE